MSNGEGCVRWLAIATLVVCAAVGGGPTGRADTLSNGIVLPAQWPPTTIPTQEYQLPSYITNPPAIIPIDLGRQLFVDDFLIESNTLTRSPHRPVVHPSPVLTPSGVDGSTAIPYSDGVWFDPHDHLFKLYYYSDSVDPVTYAHNALSYAYSLDGLNWIKPSFTNAVCTNANIVTRLTDGTDSRTVWLDQEETDPTRRFKALAYLNREWFFSSNGLDWAAGPQSTLYDADRSTLFWNPFRKIWVDSKRVPGVYLPATATRQAYQGRVRYYCESRSLTNWSPVSSDPVHPDTPICFWAGPDDQDPTYYSGAGAAPPELYNLDAVAYESLFVGLFSWFYGGGDPLVYGGLGSGPILVELSAGFSRDGFNWVRPTRGCGNNAFIPASNMPDWLGYNTQSAGGCLLVVGDELWFYFSARNNKKGTSGVASTGLATLRRDGFYSMDAGAGEGTLTTHPVTFTGNRLFVNLNAPAGQLTVEVLTTNGTTIAPFTTTNCVPATGNHTLQEVTWTGASNLSSVAGQPVKFRFHLTNGELYSFWVSTNSSGASSGYVAAGGPGFTGPTDTVGATVTVPPAGLTAFARNAQVSLFWNPATGATSYNVWRSTTNTTGFVKLNASPVIATNYRDTGLLNGSNYFYVVTSVVTGGESGNSAVVNATPVALPDGFALLLVASGLTNPQALEIAPDGRIFVAQQNGTIRLVKNDVLLPTAVTMLTTNLDFQDQPQIDTTGDRGLLGITVDSQFASNQYVYVFYTANAPTIHNRISRLTLVGDMTQPGNETVLCELPDVSTATTRMGGALHFGPDGKLYAGLGDYENPASAQSLTALTGKVLRFNPDGAVPSDNPFSNAIWAYGLRNPATSAFDPASGQFYVNDQGQTTWEEINAATAGANFNWPNTEGTTNVYAYPHTDGCAIAGGAFYSPATQQFPTNYVGKYFFQDFCSGWLRVLDPATHSATTFATVAAYPTDLRVAPDGSLYFLTRGAPSGSDATGLGAVWKLQYLAPAINQQPQSQIVSTNQSVTFTVAAVGTPPLAYQWQRNGTNITGETAASYTINSATLADNGAVFTCVITSADTVTTSRPATLTVTAGNGPVLTITAPVGGAQYNAGDTIAFAGSASDATDGQLPAAKLTWRVDFYHNQQMDQVLAPTSGIGGGTFAIPTNGVSDTGAWCRITLFAYDSIGLTNVATRDITPNLATITLATSPAGLQINLDSQPQTTPVTSTSVAGIAHTLAGVRQTVGGIAYALDHWSDGGAATHSVVFSPTTTTYTAYYRLATALDALVGWYKFTEGTGTVAYDSSSSANHATLQNGPAWSTGPTGGAMAFNGTNQYLSVGTDLSQWLGSNATLAVWIKTTQKGLNEEFSSPGVTGIEKSGDPNKIFWGWIDQFGRIGVTPGSYSPGLAQSTNNISDGTWHHIVLTRDAGSGEMKAYVDGGLSNVGTNSGGTRTTPFYSIGRIENTGVNGGTPKYLAGLLGDVRFYAAVLSATDVLTVFSGNQPPVVNAGLDQTISLPAAAPLAATATDDGLPNPPGALTFAWSKISGPGSVTFANAATTNTTATFSLPGVYVLGLTANDSASTASQTITVTVNDNFAAWCARNAVAGNLTNAPTGTGLTTLLEYAFASTPALGLSTTSPALSATNGYLTLTYRQNKWATDVTFTPEAGAALIGRAWTPLGITNELNRTDNGDFWSVTVRDNVPTTAAPQRFLRLHVTTP